jgi:hypothetical protein
MSVEVLFSDTAREDFSRVADGSPERVRIQTLLDRLAGGAMSDDHLLSAPESALELRYLSLETTFVFFRRDPAKEQATVIYFCEMDVQPAAAPLVPPPPYRLIDSQTRDIPHGMEVETAMEVTRTDGSRSLVRQFARKIDMGDSYMMVHHVARGTSPAVTMILSGRKGRIDGDFRHDELELVTLQPDGSVHRWPATTAPVWIKNPFAGVSTDQMPERVAEWAKSAEGQARFEAARKWFQLG